MNDQSHDNSEKGLDPPIAKLADEFSLRLQRGELVSIDEYIAKHPQYASQIRRAFPAILTAKKVVNEASAALLPLVYDELRKLAAAKMARESPENSMQPTALVHAAYLRLVENGDKQVWNDRGHFFGAAARAMRRILVENARRKKSQKRGGQLNRCDVAQSAIAAPTTDENILALDESLELLRHEDPEASTLVELRYFVGLTIRETAEIMEISPRKADFLWAFARAWLRKKLAN